jgi:hypothetical protein
VDLAGGLHPPRHLVALDSARLGLARRGTAGRGRAARPSGGESSSGPSTRACELGSCTGPPKKWGPQIALILH